MFSSIDFHACGDGRLWVQQWLPLQRRLKRQ